MTNVVIQKEKNLFTGAAILLRASSLLSVYSQISKRWRQKGDVPSRNAARKLGDLRLSTRKSGVRGFRNTPLVKASESKPNSTGFDPHSPCRPVGILEYHRPCIWFNCKWCLKVSVSSTLNITCSPLCLTCICRNHALILQALDSLSITEQRAQSFVPFTATHRASQGLTQPKVGQYTLLIHSGI